MIWLRLTRIEGAMLMYGKMLGASAVVGIDVFECRCSAENEIGRSGKSDVLL